MLDYVKRTAVKTGLISKREAEKSDDEYIENSENTKESK